MNKELTIANIGLIVIAIVNAIIFLLANSDIANFIRGIGFALMILMIIFCSRDLIKSD